MGAVSGCVGDRVQLVGDDMFVTSPALVRRGIEERAANAVANKPNQVGTLSEAQPWGVGAFK